MASQDDRRSDQTERAVQLFTDVVQHLRTAGIDADVILRALDQTLAQERQRRNQEALNS